LHPGANSATLRTTTTDTLPANTQAAPLTRAERRRNRGSRLIEFNFRSFIELLLIYHSLRCCNPNVIKRHDTDAAHPCGVAASDAIAGDSHPRFRSCDHDTPSLILPAARQEPE